MRQLRIAIITVLAGAFFTGCDMQQTDAATPEETAPETSEQPVKVMGLAYKKIAIEQNSTATITAFEETYLSPALQGRIRSVKVEVNDHVKQGQLLAEMDRTQLEQTRIQYQTLKTELARLDTLLKHGSVTQQAYDQTNSQVESTRLILDNLEENTLLRAPHSGIITGKYYNDGELFSPTPNTPVGKAALLSLIQVDPVKVMVNLSEKYLPIVKKGMKATIETEVYPGNLFEGTVFRIHPTVSAATRTFVAEVTVPNKNEKLHPGMFAKVSIKLGEKEGLIVPSITVLQQTGTNERYIMLDDGGKAKRVTVKILNRYDDQVEIASSQLKGGEKLIYAGQSNLENGDPVHIAAD